jgi:hypothetical protein
MAGRATLTTVVDIAARNCDPASTATASQPARA